MQVLCCYLSARPCHAAQLPLLHSDTLLVLFCYLLYTLPPCDTVQVLCSCLWCLVIPCWFSSATLWYLAGSLQLPLLYSAALWYLVGFLMLALLDPDMLPFYTIHVFYIYICWTLQPCEATSARPWQTALWYHAGSLLLPLLDRASFWYLIQALLYSY